MGGTYSLDEAGLIETTSEAQRLKFSTEAKEQRK
jgi:hypothetical protein